MRFKIHCTSHKKPPYESITEETYLEAFEWEGETDEQWFSEGENHRKENGIGMRDINVRGWFIEAGLAADLMALADDEPIILSRRKGMPDIEIYDGWRE